jgi:predicted membrane-bound spermidine synthase
MFVPLPLMLRILYLLCFIEGASVMAAELIGAKMLAPHFGSSLPVWAAVMAITLGGLALGYFAGGMMPARFRTYKGVLAVLLIAAVCMAFMPLLSKAAIGLFGYFSLYVSIVICTLTFLFPPVFLMGMVSPLLVSVLAGEGKEAGKTAGTVYALSTTGGIISTLLTGFYLIPEFGLSHPCTGFALTLGILPAFILGKSFMFPTLLLAGISSYTVYREFNPPVIPSYPVPYLSEGLLGQVMVVDHPGADSAGNITGYFRTLYVNRITQAQWNPETDSAGNYSYIDQIMGILHNEGNGKSALVLGLGGGGLANALHAAGFTVRVTELDERVEFVARKFFDLNSEIQVDVDDARRSGKMNDRKFDVIVLDLFKGEEIPGHCFTREAFSELKEKLNPGGLIFINTTGYWAGNKGAGSRALAKTLLHSGFQVEVLPTHEIEDWRNLVFAAALPGSPLMEKVIAAWEGKTLDSGPESLGDVPVLTDDKPVLEKLNMESFLAWRALSIRFFGIENKEGRFYPLYR